MAATLAVPAGAVAGPHGSCALGPSRATTARAIEVVTRHGTTHDSPFGPVHESRTIGRFAVVEGIRVVSRADCLVQLAGGYDAAQTRRPARRRRRRRSPRPRCAAGALRRRSRTRRVAGIGALRERRRALVAAGYVPPRSKLERHLRRAGGVAAVDPEVSWEATPPWWELGLAPRRRPRPGLEADHRGRRSALAHPCPRLRARPVARQRSCGPRTRRPPVPVAPPDPAAVLDCRRDLARFATQRSRLDVHGNRHVEPARRSTAASIRLRCTETAHVSRIDGAPGVRAWGWGALGRG